MGNNPNKAAFFESCEEQVCNDAFSINRPLQKIVFGIAQVLPMMSKSDTLDGSF
jgi:hypothetical protein